jgi:hypothetical protein
MGPTMRPGLTKKEAIHDSDSDTSIAALSADQKIGGDVAGVAAE